MTTCSSVCRCLFAHLRLLPRRGIYMGYHMLPPSGPERYIRVTRLWLAGATPCRGMWRRRWCRTSRCAAWPTCRTARNATTSSHPFFFMKKTSWSVGSWECIKYKPMVYVEMQDCHFHDARNGTGHSQVVPTSICVHHVREDDYAALMARFGNDTSLVARVEWVSEDTISSQCD
ncbi:putative UDP-Gal or UDP-GlcNAc-dependent glycosyltransferase [Trypanosoma cruzi]|uniref:Putative UDP-Gal or UDP-GlcNAc-dependent glycosyltransferase n=1 Tax=Trypanosoma cruzi TaxID=5693 RepID=A0A2V2UHE8_TRYCR|nr:putative UDP-Gal or UDP-GlcNAc-dependent glycosyltransferase [Trypanosoma cruzi]